MTSGKTTPGCPRWRRIRSEPCVLLDGSPLGVRRHQTCHFRKHDTYAAAEFGREIHNVSRNRARPQVPLQAQKLHPYGSGTFGAFGWCARGFLFPAAPRRPRWHSRVRKKLQATREGREASFGHIYIYIYIYVYLFCFICVCIYIYIYIYIYTTDGRPAKGPGSSQSPDRIPSRGGHTM